MHCLTAQGQVSWLQLTVRVKGMAAPDGAGSQAGETGSPSPAGGCGVVWGGVV